MSGMRAAESCRLGKARKVQTSVKKFTKSSKILEDEERRSRKKKKKKQKKTKLVGLCIHVRIRIYTVYTYRARE